ncbi:MAG: DsbA family oxidoreductase [Congregibacter sp.]|nr:DsbA family oxidoreductase [Congregibacter sp.]
MSDVVCPWCVIGYKQFEKALATMPGHFDVTVHWRPFELNPQMPPEGQDLREHIAQKYGSSAEQSQQARARLSSIGDSLGFHFDYFDGMRVVNTFRAHQLLHWAEAKGKQTDLKLALFSAFFSQRQDVSDDAVLLSVAESVGLPRAEAEEVLVTGSLAEEVREDQRWWLDREIHAVPAFIFNDKYSVLGAQEADTFVRVLNKLEAKAVA